MPPRDDLSLSDIHAVMAALRHLKEDVLFAFGAEGDECIQRLVSVEARLQGEGPIAQVDIFRALHAGMSASSQEELPVWTGEPALRPAYETGLIMTRLNAQRRRDSGLNVGPMDMPKTEILLARALVVLRD